MSSSESKSNKSYVWVRLSALSKTSASAHRRSNVNDAWGWTPAFYCTVNDRDSVDSGEERPAPSSSVSEAPVRLTLLPIYHSADNSCEGNDDIHQMDEYTLTESQKSSLLSSGDIVLANQWEQHDFENRLSKLGVGSNDTDDESDYNYDESDSDSENDFDDDGLCNNERQQMSQLLDEGQNDDSPPPNLINLTHLHECSVVHALRHRYRNTHLSMSQIYTDTGPILLAVNPFKNDESGVLYGEETAKRYRLEGERKWLSERSGGKSNASVQNEPSLEERSSKSLDPHVYAVADRTYRTMISRLTDTTTNSNTTSKSASQKQQQHQLKVNQSVLVSGESGSGKTVTTKLIMGYLAKLSEQPLKNNLSDESNGTSTQSPESTMSIERRVLESNPILESFGNARTVRNDNSSRFGKYIEMKFSSSLSNQPTDKVVAATLTGASIETYLLEKVRLVHQSNGERNYHIFYELFSMEYNEEEEDFLDRLGLDNHEMEDFSLINNSDTYDRRDGVQDTDTGRDMRRAMTVMGIEITEQHSIFAVCCALLHASNLTFVNIGEVECALEMENPHLNFVVDLLGITREGLNKALCYYEITVGGGGSRNGETHRKELSQAQAQKGIEALIKAAYGAMFQYLVDRINKSIAGDGNNDKGRNISRSSRRKGEQCGTIGILDIFGFEHFQLNSFEQLCINYCNEALQQQFNRFVLRNEQEEYSKEGIPWSFIEFPENKDVLDLIDQKGIGLLNILHDQCRTPGACDKTFALLIYDKCADHSRFEASSRQRAEQQFAIHHYAGLVEYDIEGFVEKNRDELPKEASDLLLSSTNDFVRRLANILQPPTPVVKNKLQSPRSGASHRPTVGVQFSSQLQSLRCKIDETSPHYIRCLKPNNSLVSDVFDPALIADQLRCAGVIEAVRVSRLGYPQRYSYNQFISRYRILGMKALKKRKNPKKFNPAKALVHAIKTSFILDGDQDDIGVQVGKTKVFLKRESYDALERLRRDKITSSVIIIQKNARCFVYRTYYAKVCSSVISIQCFLRCAIAKDQAINLRRQHRSIIVQSYWRRYAAAKLYAAAKIIAIWSQSHLRGSLCRHMYKKMVQDRKAICIQSIWRRYIAVRDLIRYRSAAITVQCAIRSYKSRVILSELKSHARDLHAVQKERDMLRQEVIALKKVTQNSNMIQSSSLDADIIAEKDTEIASLRSALDFMSSENERLEQELQFLKSKDGLQRVRNEDAQSSPVVAMRFDHPSHSVGNIADSQIDLHNEIARLNDINSKLQQENFDLSEKHASALISSHVKAPSDFSRRETVLAANTSVCTSFTADITDTDEDMTKLREENQILRKQLEFLRGMGPSEVIPDDQEYDESVAPGEESTGSEENNFIGDAHALHATSSDKSDQDERIRLQQLTNELREELRQTKKHAKYELDDVNRVNESLRRDLERAEYTSTALNDELDQKYDEYESLQEDLEKFAETFAVQHEEMQQLEVRLKKLTAEKEELQSSNKDKTEKISTLEAQLESTKTSEQNAPEWVGDEIGKLWNEISRLKGNE